MKLRRGISLATFALLLIAFWATSALAKNEEKIIKESGDVLQEAMKIPEKGIPPALLKDAKAVAFFPGVIKGAFMVGGEHGRGVLLVRQENGGWSNPIFLTITAGSFGWQIGGEATDLILVFKTLKGVEKMMKGKFTVGADAAAAAGPVGRNAEAATDVMLKAEILSYSRSRGLFAGLSLEGAALLIDKDADAKFYGKAVTAPDLAMGKGHKKSGATKRLQGLLTRYSEMK
jgi:lipid-binding SYLF domain-containing protein